MPGMFEQILEIKQFRENRAELAVSRQRTLLTRAQAVEKARREVLEDFRLEAARKEKALYDDLFSRVVRLSAIQDVHLAVDAMQGEERSHQADVERAQADCHQQAELLRQARETHAQALQVKERFVELVRLAAEEAATEEDLKETLELEEVAETRSGRLRRLQQDKQEQS